MESMFEKALGWTSSHPSSSSSSSSSSSCSFSSQKDNLCLIKDTVASPGSFVLTIFLKRILVSSDPSKRPPLVVFVGLSEPFSHYSRIARKQGIDLAAYQKNGVLVFVDMLSMPSSLEQETSTGNCNVTGNTQVSAAENKLFKLFNFIVQLLKREPGRAAWILVDDVALLEVVAEGNRNHLLDFLHYCRTFSSSKQKCSIVLLAHQDVYQSSEERAVANQLEHWSDTVIMVQPLATGYSHDVHGQMIIQHRTPLSMQFGETLNESSAIELPNICHLHYKLVENTVKFFPPGKQTLF